MRDPGSFRLFCFPALLAVLLAAGFWTQPNGRAAAASTLPSAIQESGQLTVCEPDFPAGQGATAPMESLVNQAVARQLGVRLTVLYGGHDVLLNALHVHRCQAAFDRQLVPPANGTDIGIVFSAPFASWAEGLFAAKTNQQVKTANDLSSHNIGVVAGSFAANYFQQEGYTVAAYKNATEALLAVHDDKVDVALIERGDAQAALAHDPALAASIKEVTTYVPDPRARWNLAYAVRADEPDLVRAIDTAVQQLLANGTLQRAVASAGGAYLPPVTGAQLAQLNAPAVGPVLRACQVSNSLPLSDNRGATPGYEVEVARATAQVMGRQLQEYWEDTYDDLITDLKARDCDVVIAGFLVSPDLLAVAGTTIPYYSRGNGVFVRAGSGLDVRQIADLRSQRVGVELGTFSEDLLQDKGIDTYQLLPNLETILAKVDQGQLDAAFVDVPMAVWTLRQHPDWHVQMDRDFVPQNRFNVAMVVRKDDTSLQNALNQALERLLQSGKIQHILASYGIPYWPPTGKPAVLQY